MAISFRFDRKDSQFFPILQTLERIWRFPVGVFYISLLISVRGSNVFCCHHWFFFWYLIPPDSPILQKYLVERIYQRHQCLFSYFGLQFTFPNGDRVPAHSGKFDLHFHITLFVTPYFVGPEFRIGFRYSVIATAFMPMPEASIHKDTRPVLPHHNIWLPRQSWMIKPITESTPP